MKWPNGSHVSQVRIARPTSRLKEVVAFYKDGLGLLQISSFENHAGYSGVMLGLPDKSYHLEFTQHEGGSPCPAPTKDNLLVLYLPEKKDVVRLAAQLRKLGHAPVPPENPYWNAKGLTFEDPDGWRVVLMETPGI